MHVVYILPSELQVAKGTRDLFNKTKVLSMVDRDLFNHFSCFGINKQHVISNVECTDTHS